MIIYWHLNATKRHKMRLILMTIFRDKSLWLFLNTCLFDHLKQNTENNLPNGIALVHPPYHILLHYTKSIEEFSTNAFLYPKATFESVLYEYMCFDSKGQGRYNGRSSSVLDIYQFWQQNSGGWTRPFRFGGIISFPLYITTHVFVLRRKSWLVRHCCLSLQKASASVFSITTCAYL